MHSIQNARTKRRRESLQEMGVLNLKGSITDRWNGHQTEAKQQTLDFDHQSL